MNIKRFGDRFQKWWERTPPSFSGSVLANYLGWQIARVFWFNFWRRIGFFSASKEVQEYTNLLEKDGIVLIPNFLPEEVFKEIRNEFKKDIEGVALRPLASPYIVNAGKNTKVGYRHFFPEKGSRLHELLDTHIMKDSKARGIGSTVAGHAIASYRDPQVFVNEKISDDYPDLNSDIYYHADVSYPGVKAFYYLSDTTEENGAFTYAKGTHTLTLKRLLWEYRKSIEHAKNRRRVNDSSIQGDETGRSWHCLTRDEEKEMGITGTPMVGKANSLVVFNVMGFHRRGEFTSDSPREFAVAYYRK